MKNNIILITILLLLTSCLGIENEDRERFGFHFRVENQTQIEYSNATVTIGTIENGIFIPSETLKLPIIPGIKGKTYWFFQENRWNPNLENIEKASFKLKLNEKREGFLVFPSPNNPLVRNEKCIKIPENKIISTKDTDIWRGELLISIRENNVTF